MTARHPCDVYRVARQCGVVLRDSFEHSPTSRRPKECFCKPTLKKIGRSEGEGHLLLVLQLMVGTRTNSLELYADMIKAVSSLLVRNPHLVKRPTLLQDFDAIDLGSLRRKADGMNVGIATTHVLRVLLSLRFYAPMQGDLLDWMEREAA
jgi:hypothetical protein